MTIITSLNTVLSKSICPFPDFVVFCHPCMFQIIRHLITDKECNFEIMISFIKVKKQYVTWQLAPKPNNWYNKPTISLIC